MLSAPNTHRRAGDMRWLWIDRPMGLVVLVALAVAFRLLLLPAATDDLASDELLGAAQVVWLGLCLLLPLAVGLLLLRLVQRLRRP
jgi:hypothetical protein